jgi:hypothetical protein
LSFYDNTREVAGNEVDRYDDTDDEDCDDVFLLSDTDD